MAAKKTAAKKKTTKRRVPTIARAKQAIADSGGRKVGRPVRAFEPKTGEAIVEAVGDGLDIITAGDLCGVHRQVLARWVMDNEEFASALKKGQAEHVQATLQRLRDLPAGQWQKAAWELERMYPDRFGQNARLEISGTAKLEVSGAVCTQLSDSWRKFKGQVIDAEEVKT